MPTTILGDPICLSPPAPGCPISVVAARVPSTQRRDGTRRFATGWGASQDEATQRCTWEAAERYSAQLGDEQFRRATARALGRAAVSPAELLLIGDEQYADRYQWNAENPGFSALPARWIESQPIDWVLANSVLVSTDRWLPAGLVFLGHDRDRKAGLPPADSNGVAAGQTLEDAAARAFLELIERDAVAIWWYNRLARPRISHSDLGDSLVSAYAAWSRGRGRPVQLCDLIHDLETPVVAAIAHDVDGGSIALGFGAGRSAAEAARHAVGELAQFECNAAMIEAHVAARGEHGLTPEARALRHWSRTATIARHPHLAGGETTAPTVRNVPLTLGWCRELCRKHGLKFLAVDLTRPAVAIPVVRVVVPGLRPMWARFAPGRLFDVPVRLGWLAAPLAPDALNPTPLMF